MPDSNRYSRQTFSPDGVNREYPFDVPYLQDTHLTLIHGETPLAYGTEWELANPTTIRTAAILEGGTDTLVVRRSTSIASPVATFVSPGTFTFGNLNRIVKQLLYAVQEAFDRSLDAVETASPIRDGEVVANLASLKGLTSRPRTVIMAYRTTPGDFGGGIFNWRSGNQSANVAADPRNGIWVPPNTDTTGASGAWERLYSGHLDARWFGLKADRTTDDSDALQAVADWVRAAEHRSLRLPGGTIRITRMIDFSAHTASTQARPVIYGDSQSATVIRVDFARSPTNYAAFRFGERSGARQRTSELYDIRFEYAAQTDTQPLFLDVYGAGQFEMSAVRMQAGKGQVARFTSVQNFRSDRLSVIGPVGKTYLYKDLQGPRRGSFTATMAVGTPGVVSRTNHGLQPDDPIRWTTTGALLTGQAVGTTYYVKDVLTANTFSVAATPGGSAIAFSGSQSGTHTLWHAKYFFDLANGDYTLVASGGSPFDAGFEGRRFVGVSANGTRYHFDVASYTDGTHVELDRPGPTDLAFLWGTIEGARGSMSAGSDVFTADCDCFAGDAANHEGRRFWITKKDTSKRMESVGILEKLADNSVRLDWTADEDITDSPFMVPGIEFDTDPGLSGVNSSAPSVDVKMSNLYTSEYTGALLAMKNIKQGRIVGMKLESGSSINSSDQPSAAMLLDSFDGTIEGDVSAPNHGKARIIMAGQTSPLVIPNLITRIGFYEPEYLLQQFPDPNGLVLIGALSSIQRDTNDPVSYIDEGSTRQYYQFGMFASGHDATSPRFLLGNTDAYLDADAGLFVPRTLGQYTEPAIASNVLTLDLSLGEMFKVANNANITTFTITDAVAGRTNRFDLILTANGTGYTQAWGASVVWPNGVAPTLTTTNGKRDWLSFETPDGGTTWFASVKAQNL